MSKINRKEFFRISGSIVGGGAIAGVSGKLIWNMFRQPEKMFFVDGDESAAAPDEAPSPYRKLASARIETEIEAFDLLGDRMVVAGGNLVTLYSPEGEVESRFGAGPDIRDLVVAGDEIYILFPAHIDVYSLDGHHLRGWEACSDESDYCSMAVTPKSVFVTDAAAKNICQYAADGSLVRFINSPAGFVVPSYSFGIAHREGVVYVSNPGRHRIEKYDEEGQFLGAFGQAGTDPGSFSGCCNPVHLSVSPAGEIITSEKGLPRVSCYSPEGEFRSFVLNGKSLGGGHDAYEARIGADGRVFVAGKHSLAVYKYDSALAGASSTACSLCGIQDCPIRRGINV